MKVKKTKQYRLSLGLTRGRLLKTAVRVPKGLEWLQSPGYNR